MHEPLPVVHIHQDMLELAGLADVGDVPVVADGLAGPAGVLGDGLAAGPEADARIKLNRLYPRIQS